MKQIVYISFICGTTNSKLILQIEPHHDKFLSMFCHLEYILFKFPVFWILNNLGILDVGQWEHAAKMLIQLGRPKTKAAEMANWTFGKRSREQFTIGNSRSHSKIYITVYMCFDILLWFVLVN